LYIQSCDKGFAVSCDNLGLLEDNKRNKSSAIRSLKGLRDGACRRLLNLANLELRLGDESEAKRLFGISCGMGESVGCYAVGNLEEQEGNL